MEDNNLFKGEYVYSVRVDVVDFKKSTEQMVLSKFKEYFTRACVARENKKDGTPHYQCCMWRNTKLPQKESSTIRTYFKQKFNYDYSNAVSIVSARKVESLAKYCNNKEKKGVISWGISDLSILGQWENKQANQEKLKDLLIEKLSSMRLSEEISMKQVCIEACKIYVDCRPPPFKSLLQIGRSSGYIPQRLFIAYYYKDLQFEVDLCPQTSHCRNNYVEQPSPNSFGVPPIEEQNTILSYLSCEDSESDSEATNGN